MSEASDIESNMDPETPITEPQTPLGSGRKILSCSYQGCTKSFNRQARLNEHIRSHTNERPFKCPQEECGKAFLRDSHLKHHIKSAHTNERNYSCTWVYCDRKFATGTRLRRHEATHEEKEKYTCKGFDGCNETFRKHATLARHIMSVHENKKPFPCIEIDAVFGEQCNLGFNTAEKLRSHRRAVHDQTRFVCTNCRRVDNELDTEVSFATYALLQTHIAEVHPPTCPQCSLPCASEKDLRRHLELAHNVVDQEAESSHSRTFSCTYPQCSRSFTKKGNLNVHVKTVHEHRKDFVCGQAELKFPHRTLQSQDLELVEDPEMSGCGRHFTSKATLEEHVRTVHLGMNSKRQERNRKRRAENAIEKENLDAESGGRTKRRKKSRDGKSAIAELSGSASLAAGAGYEEDSGVGNPFDGAAYPTAYDYGFDQDFNAQPFPEHCYDHSLTQSGAIGEDCDEASLGIGLSSLAASVLVDPVLLSG